MISKPIFPTDLHKKTAEIVYGFFAKLSNIDTVLVVNSCARGQAVPESDLDFAILVKEETSTVEITDIEQEWLKFSMQDLTILNYKKSSPFAHLHLDLIKGIYTPQTIEIGEPWDYFEIEIGNHICYSAPMGNQGDYFNRLQNKWLPYYDENLRLQRFNATINACHYDLGHIQIFVKRELYFQAFDILCKAFQEFLQALFIAKRTYPIAYNKWIKYQVIELINEPDLYPLLSPILSISTIESSEIIEKVKSLRNLLNSLKYTNNDS
jgi:predicted nucleotidyltransferase